jgi:DNA topoisomerase-1
MESAVDPLAAAQAVGLRYTLDDIPGIRRQRRGRGWQYLNPDGSPIYDAIEIARIKAIVIPPAWTDVWINPSPRGHLQATGRDTRGRKQYRYHLKWRAFRDETKFSRLVIFGQALPSLREQVTHDLGLPGLPRNKALAAVVRLLDESLIRVGNEEYARQNGSYGLTTLRDEHVTISGATMHFTFRGKSGTQQQIDVRDRRLARIVSRMQDLPGQHLFQYLDDQGETQSIGSQDVNDYLRQITGEEFTAKEFRTWAGTVLAARALRAFGPAETQTERHAHLVAAVDAVAKRLGNTRAVCRASYIHPAIIAGYEDGSLCDFTAKSAFPGLDADEAWTLAYLSRES